MIERFPTVRRAMIVRFSQCGRQLRLQLQPQICYFLKKVKNRSFLRKRLLLSACFRRAKRLPKHFLIFRLLLNCLTLLKLSHSRHNSYLPRLNAGAVSLIFLKKPPSFTFFKKSMQPASKNERECGAAGEIRPRIGSEGAADHIERVIPAAFSIKRRSPAHCSQGRGSRAAMLISRVCRSS